MQSWPSLGRQLAAILDSIAIYISVPPFNIKGQRLFVFHVVIEKTKKKKAIKPQPSDTSFIKESIQNNTAKAKRFPSMMAICISIYKAKFFYF